MNSIEKREDDIVDLGVASEETKGVPHTVTIEAFLSRPPADELSAD